MAHIAAFVGHSFLEEDKDVNRQFLDYLDDISKLNIGFTWDHAESAEPAELSRKVRTKMEGKNVFIGICTRKERAIAAGELARAWFNGRKLWAAQEHFEWKTSDWLVQEIGYACGKNMQLIVLLEEGVRRPGGLQGDVEYIPFSRERPSDAYPKILQMLRALPPTTTAQETSLPPVERSDTVTAAEISPELSKQIPEPTWTASEYESAAFGALLERNEQQLKVIHDAFNASTEGQDEKKKDEFEAFVLHCQRLLGMGGNFERLRAIAKKYPKNSTLQTYLAQAYQAYDQFDKAVECYTAAAKNADTDDRRIEHLASAAVAKHRNGDKASDVWLKNEIYGISLSEEAQRNVFWALRELYDKEGHPHEWLALTEARLAMSPDDVDLRFNLAYKYHEHHNARLSLYHYRKIPTEKRLGGTWNNIGVTYNTLDLKGRSVTAYKKAQEMGDILAVSNLAHLFLKEGFLDDAEQMCRAAIAQGEKNDYQKNLASAIVSIGERKGSETVSLNKIMAAAEIEHHFMLRVGEACIVRDVPKGDTLWQTTPCNLNVKIQDRHFSATGQYTVEEAAGLLSSIFGGGVHATSKPTKKIMHVAYSGHIVGHTVFCERKLTAQGATPSLLGENERDSVILFNQDLTDAEEFYRNSKQEGQWEKWKKMEV